VSYLRQEWAQASFGQRVGNILAFEDSMDTIGILILDDDAVSQAALVQVLDSEGWEVRVVGKAHEALAELARGTARLVIANVAMIGVAGPVFEILSELALATAAEGARAPARVLFLVPALTASEVQPILERAGLPYLLKPYHLHDFFEKVSDLLLEGKAIETPLQNLQFEFRAAPRPLVRDGTRLEGRRNEMFAARAEYMMTEEEMLEYERQEAEEIARKKKKTPKTGDYPQ
jgi:DNA-binding response OmpR family regulator